jgi:hypothetical protein
MFTFLMPGLALSNALSAIFYYESRWTLEDRRFYWYNLLKNFNRQV